MRRARPGRRRPGLLAIARPAAAAAAVAVVVMIVVAVAVAVGGTIAAAQTTEAEAARTLSLVPNGSDVVRRGAVLYDHHCSACHGDTGGGMAEAVAGFPHDERRCTACHKPGNPPRMDHLAMTWRNAFDIGDAPPLIGPAADLARFRTGRALFGYVRATMPRPWPGSLGEEEYLAITAFLAAAGGADVPERVSAPAELDAVRLDGVDHGD